MSELAWWEPIPVLDRPCPACKAARMSVPDRSSWVRFATGQRALECVPCGTWEPLPSAYAIRKAAKAERLAKLEKSPGPLFGGEA